MKKVFTSIILTLVLLMTSIPTFAANSNIVVDGITLNSDVLPETKNNRIMVPLRVVSENLGVKVDWSNSVVTLTKNKMKVTLTTKSNIAIIDGVKVTLDAKPYLKNNRVFVPLRFITETFNGKIDYSNHTVTINTTPLFIDGVEIKAVQEEYHMTMGGVEQQISGNAYIGDLYQLLAENKGKPVDAPANFSWESHPSSGIYNKLRQYDFLDLYGNSILQADVFYLVGYSQEEYKDMPHHLLYNSNTNQWYLIDEQSVKAIWMLSDTATNNGFIKVISNTVP